MKICFVLSLSVLSLSAGCIKPSAQVATDSGETTTSSVTAEEATPRETMNKTTQNVLNLEQAMADGGVLAATSVEATNPLTQSADVYRTTVGKLGAMAVQQAIQIRDAQSIKDPKPLSYDEFMREIIKKDMPDGIQLSMLPYYQEYAWDVKNQKLVTIDFPARKEARQQQLDNN